MFSTIRQASRTLGVPEHFIRGLVASGNCPGVYSGTRFLVHVAQLRELLDAQSAARKKEDVAE